MLMPKRIVVLVGGSDLFSGIRGISKGTKIIQEKIESDFDEVIAVNYNYFLDFGRSLNRLYHHIISSNRDSHIVLYGYSKGGEIVLQLARKLESIFVIPLLVTIDIANGPWSKNVDRTVPANVLKNVNVYQGKPNFPLRSFGMPAIALSPATTIENIDITAQTISGIAVTHSTIENLMVNKVVEWIKAETVV